MVNTRRTRRVHIAEEVIEDIQSSEGGVLGSLASGGAVGQAGQVDW